MKKLLSFFCLCLCYMALSAQKPYAIQGMVQDTAAGQKLYHASVLVLRAADSTLLAFTRAEGNGHFRIEPLEAGAFILLLSYPNYVDYIQSFELNDSLRFIDFKAINMKLKATLLREVQVNGETVAIRIKGDTTEFNASSFTIQPNDKVEDLLKKMPGIQIDKEGKITAQGKTVPKILVDGEEFFGDDPTLVTTNLRADMVDKVQVYEKKSDQATFSGVDDGEKTQTINIVLKEDKKKGIFGNAEAGLGNDEFYTGKLLFNKFKPKERIALFGIFGNNGRTGLNWEDNMAFSNGDGLELMDEGLIQINSTDDEIGSFDGGFSGTGIPAIHNGGFHYDKKWNNDKESLNSNYKIGAIRNKGFGSSINVRNLPAGTINTESDQTNSDYVFRHKLDLSYLIKIDSNSTLKIGGSAGRGNTDSENRYATRSSRNDHSLLNTEERELNNEGTSQNINWSVFYTQKARKAGRNFSINLQQFSGQSKRKGFLFSRNTFYNSNSEPDSTEVTDQLKTNFSKNTSFSGSASYSEPFSKTLSLVITYGLTLHRADADRRSYNADSPGVYDQFDAQYSNHFISEQRTQRAGTMLAYKKGKTLLNGGLNINAVNFDQTDQNNWVDYHRRFINWMPQARYQYRFSPYRTLSADYYGSTSQPDMEQLQPIKVNDDVMNIPIGNPLLKPSYNNRVGMSYNTYKVISNTSFFAYGSISTTHQQIVNNTTTDPETGKTSYQYINLQEKTPLNYNLSATFSKMLKNIDTRLNLSLRNYGGRSYNYINTVLNEISRNTYGIDIGLEKYKEKAYSFDLYITPNYSIQESSVNPGMNNNGFTCNIRSDFSIYLPAGTELNGDGQYNYTAKTASFGDSYAQLIVNASLSKHFFKAQNLTINLSVNDLFNQNTDFYRYASNNNIVQSTNNTIKRFFMLSISWDFNKMGVNP